MIKRLLSSLDPSSRARVILLQSSITTPMIAFTGLKLVEDSPLKTEFIVPLNWRTRNSWGTMFFAGIATGVDLTGGWCALRIAEEQSIGMLYKDIKESIK